MAANEITRGNKLSMLTQLASMLVLFATILLAWGRVDTRITMAEHRIIQLESRSETALTRRESDNAALLSLAAEVKAQNVTISIASDTLKRLEQRMIEVERAPVPRR
jgi:hypothetical protein